MSIRILAAVFLACTIPTFAQENEITFDQRPHFVIIPTLSLNSGGFQPVSASGTVGTRFEGRFFLFQSDFTYDTARKTDDETLNNTKGHTRSFRSYFSYRLPARWYLGGGAGWSETSTTNYTKGAWAPYFGGGKDFFRNSASFRLSCFYKLPGSDHFNATQGPSLEFIYPSPLKDRHFYFYQSVSTTLFHTTITDPNNAELAEEQREQRSVFTRIRMGIMFRF